MSERVRDGAYTIEIHRAQLKVLIVGISLVQGLLEPCQKLKGGLVFSFSIQAVGFDVCQALRIAESVTLAVDVKK